MEEPANVNHVRDQSDITTCLAGTPPPAPQAHLAGTALTDPIKRGLPLTNTEQ